MLVTSGGGKCMPECFSVKGSSCLNVESVPVTICNQYADLVTFCELKTFRHGSPSPLTANI